MAEKQEETAGSVSKEDLKLLEWLIRPKPAFFILLIKNSRMELSITDLSKSSDMSYVHAMDLIKKIEAENYIETESKGNRRMVRLTKKGETMATYLEDMIRTGRG